ncbi:DELLA protein SLR1-like [Triticum dicoccoides]|uniref:DELLA protein SLR1-like n=1 Tax=Triticum dicoccoides TaxID=85692 RepID=UPI00188FEF92|nr:DELLA protein SLR1-like [Triticum dicoccoides]
MGHFAFGWQGKEPAAANSPSGAGATLSLQSVQGTAAATTGADTAHCLDPATYAPAVPPMVPPPVAEATARRCQEAENIAVYLIHVLHKFAETIEAGDYAAAAGKLAEARTMLATSVSTTTGIGRVASHFAAALAQRLFPASPQYSFALDASTERAGELYRRFYDAGPYLKFAHFTANQAILEAFEGCDRVHVVDLAIKQGMQWPALIQALSIRPGGPPSVRITGVGSAPGADEVGLRLAEFARTMNVPFSFQRVTDDSLDQLQPWMFQVLPGEAVAVNSICQLHRLLVNPDAASTSLPTPIDVVLGWIASMQPRVFTVVEQEADHNKPRLVTRFDNAMFYYGSVLDSMEAMSVSRGGAIGNGAGADAYVQREIFNIVCYEGSARTERHEPLAYWCARLWRTGLTHVPLGPSAAYQAAKFVRVFSGTGFRVQEIGGCLSLAWHDHPLFTVSVWSAMPADGAGTAKEHADKHKLKMSIGESSGAATCQTPRRSERA